MEFLAPSIESANDPWVSSRRILTCLRFQLFSCSVSILLCLPKFVVDSTNICVDGSLSGTACLLLDLRSRSFDQRESRLDVGETAIGKGVGFLQQRVDWTRQLERSLARSLDCLSSIASQGIGVELVKRIVD